MSSLEFNGKGGRIEDCVKDIYRRMYAALEDVIAMGRLHSDSYHEKNLLSRGQEIAVEVDEGKATDVALKVGEFSLHHVLLTHGPHPNNTGNRRIGLAIRYIPTSVHQTKIRDCAMLVRGVDNYGHFDLMPDPKSDFDAAARAVHGDATERLVAALYSGTDKTEMLAWTGVQTLRPKP